MDEEETSIAATLEAYERQKRAQLSDQGREGLVRELAKLEHFLDNVEEAREALQDVVEFRRGKARVLREILSE